jgi:hypothetical protein
MIRRLFQKLKDTVGAVNRTATNVAHIQQVVLRRELERLRSRPKCSDPKHLTSYGAKVYCQCDEDGIVAEIFHRVGTTNKCFMEFGIGDGLENNTHALLFDGWQGLWIDASSRSVSRIRNSWSSLIATGRLKVVESFITAENINGLIRDHVEHTEIDFLSVDIDGNDYHVLSAINCLSARVIAIEYNSKFLPPLSYCMTYDPTHCWGTDDNFGASLKFLEVKLRAKNYSLVGCSLSGSNAFFVRSDLVADKFLEPFTAENHYEPARYHLTSVNSGHASSFDALEKMVYE